MVKCLMDSYQLLVYPNFDDVKALIETITEFFDMIPFNGNKILKKGVAADVAWY